MDDWNSRANQQPGGGGKRKWKQHQHYHSSALEKGRERSHATNSKTSIPGRRKSRLTASGLYVLLRVAHSSVIGATTGHFVLFHSCWLKFKPCSVQLWDIRDSRIAPLLSANRQIAAGGEFDRAWCMTDCALLHAYFIPHTHLNMNMGSKECFKHQWLYSYDWYSLCRQGALESSAQWQRLLFCLFREDQQYRQAKALMFFETYFIYLMEAPHGLWNDTCLALYCTRLWGK